MKYGEALAVLDQALEKEPDNFTAELLKEVIGDARVAIDYRDAVGGQRLAVAQGPVSDKQASVEYNDLLTYPTNWPEISEERLTSLNGVEASRNGGLVVYDVRGLLVQVPDFTNGPSFDLQEALEETENGPRNAEVHELIELVRTAAADASDDEQTEVSVREIRGNLVVKADAETQQKVARALNQLALARSKDLVDPMPGASGAAEPEPPATRTPKLMPVNPWVMAANDHLSTFALDVDTASYRIAGRSIRDGVLPPRHTVRMEEFVNAFDYAYPSGRRDTDVFAVHTEAAWRRSGRTWCC